MQPASTPKPPFDARGAADLLRAAFQAEADAIRRAPPGQPKGDLSPSARTERRLADGSDLLQALAASLDKAKAA
ncbi:hypothetical protein JCM3770_002236 [Rhodotorula araucariae]